MLQLVRIFNPSLRKHIGHWFNVFSHLSYFLTVNYLNYSTDAFFPWKVNRAAIVAAIRTRTRDGNFFLFLSPARKERIGSMEFVDIIRCAQPALNFEGKRNSQTLSSIPSFSYDAKNTVPMQRYEILDLIDSDYAALALENTIYRGIYPIQSSFIFSL